MSEKAAMSYELNHLGQPVGRIVENWQSREAPPREATHGTYCAVEPLNAEVHGRALYEANGRDTEGRNWTYFSYGPFASFEAYYDWLSRSAASADPMFFAIIDKATDKPTGVASYMRMDRANGSIEVGHVNFSPLLQATRVATEAMYLMMKTVFELGYRRYEWKANALNAPSRRAAQRFGFSYEGIFRQVLVVKGRNRDSVWYAAIDQDWPVLKKAFTQWLDPANFDPDGRQKVSLSSLTEPLLRQRG
jgi:RimJ/RimL family protein N-acetyltransferase